MNDETRRELTRLLSVIVPRLFDDDPIPAIGRLRVLMQKHGLHPTQLGISINGLDQVADLKRERDEAMLASWRDVKHFTAAWRAKGYTREQIIKALEIQEGLMREWDQLGRVPAVFFSILANAPTRKQWSAEVKAEVRLRVIEEQKKRSKAAKAAAKRLAKERRKVTVPPPKPVTAPGVINYSDDLLHWEAAA